MKRHDKYPPIDTRAPDLYGRILRMAARMRAYQQADVAIVEARRRAWRVASLAVINRREAAENPA